MKRAFLLALTLAACDNGFMVPEDTRRMDPPSVYRLWHAQTVACVAIQRDFDRIRWYVVPGGNWRYSKHNQDLAAGVWIEPDKIYIAEESLTTEWIIKHELIHYLIRLPKHPADVFRRCSIA